MATTLTQLELDHRNIDCGMSYVFHLEDGRFFIIDGGYFTPGEADRLYEFLLQKSGGEKPVIAGWFFSHAHQDHIGAFIEFTRKYLDKAVIEQLLFHFQPIDYSWVKEEDGWKSSDEATAKEFYRVLETDCKHIPVVTPHTGDVLRFGELTVEVLYTQEDLWPTPACGNDYSTVIAVNLCGQRILFLGDAEPKADQVLLDHNKDALACDILQVAHHGFNGSTIELYAQTHAKVALWPSPAPNMEQNRATEVNHYILNDMGITDHIVSGYGTAELCFPYVPGSAKREDKQFYP